MKKSKSSTSSKSKRKHSSSEDKKKLPKCGEKQSKKEVEEKLPRKTRWETSDKDDADKQVPSRSCETSNPEPPRRIRDMLGDKKKVIEYLFLTVTGPTLQELIPDYLKSFSIEELKKMCYDEIKHMDEEIILNILSGKFSSNSDEEKLIPHKEDVKAMDSTDMVSEEGHFNIDKRPSPYVSDTMTSDLLELCASSGEMKDLADNETSVDEEALEQPVNIDSDADLIELEMRARAIRSLLKAKSQSLSDSD